MPHSGEVDANRSGALELPEFLTMVEEIGSLDPDEEVKGLYKVTGGCFAQHRKLPGNPG